MWLLILLFILAGCSAKVRYGDFAYDRRGEQELRGLKVEITKTETTRTDGTMITKTITIIKLDEQNADTEAITQALKTLERAAEVVIKRSYLP